MKRIILLPALFIVLTAGAQSVQYKKIEVTHFTKDRDITSKLIKYEGGTVDVDSKTITIDKESPKPTYYTIAKEGTNEPQDEGYFLRECLCISENKSRLKALKILLVYSPKKELCDVVVKDGSKNIDYCITDK